MPGYDGTGPQGEGPMTGRGLGFCLLRESRDKLGLVEGLAGIQGVQVNFDNNNLNFYQREVVNMPGRYLTSPYWRWPMSGRAAGYRPGFGAPVFAAYGAGLYGYRPGYGAFYGRRANPMFVRGFGRGFGRGRRRGRGGFGFRW